MIFVTVTHLKEIYWLQLQAKSMDLFLNDDQVREVIVVINEENNEKYVSLFNNIVKPHYGKHISKLKLIERNDVLKMPIYTHGWRSQQALKLAIIDKIDVIDENYIVIIMDTKNHFIKKINNETFIHSDGRIKSWKVSHEGHMAKYFHESLRNFELESEYFIKEWTPTITPYCVFVRDVKECIFEIKNKFGQN